jgi:hypothetical protein
MNYTVSFIIIVIIMRQLFSRRVGLQKFGIWGPRNRHSKNNLTISAIVGRSEVILFGYK